MTKKLSLKYDCACAVDGCDRPAKVRALCHRHYKRLLATGSPVGMRPGRNGVPYAWILENARHEGSECLLWPFAINVHGYGVVRIPDVAKSQAHRVMCFSAHGVAPSATHQAAHSCGVRACVNPNHLRWATPAENMADTLLHGTHKHGQKNPNARLTNEQAQALRELALAEVAPQSELAARFGVSQQVVSRIKRGEAYRNAQLVAAIKAQEAEKRAGK